MSNTQCPFDLMGRQRRFDQEGIAIEKFLEAAEHIKSIDAEQHRQSNQLHEQTDQLKAHNESFKELNARMEQEAKERELGDRKNRRITIFAVILTCVLTFFFDHIFDLYHFLFQG